MFSMRGSIDIKGYSMIKAWGLIPPTSILNPLFIHARLFKMDLCNQRENI